MKFTLLTRDQVWGKNALDMMRKYGAKVAPTDLTVLLGGEMVLDHGGHTPEGHLTTTSWTQTAVGTGYVSIVHFWGNDYWDMPYMRHISVRPVISPKDAKKIQSPTVQELPDFRICKYGEYPQTLAGTEYSDALEKLYAEKKLEETGKVYTFDATSLSAIKEAFKPAFHPEYRWQGNKYIRMLGTTPTKENRLSDGQSVQPQKPYWVKVEKVNWLIDKSGTYISQKCLFAGIPFDVKREYDGNFKKTVMRHYLDTYFAREIEPSERISRQAKKNLSKLFSFSGVRQR